MWSDSDGEHPSGRSSSALVTAGVGGVGGVGEGADATLAAVAASAASPTIAQLNVTKNSRMHIGPKFEYVTQNVHKAEVVKGKVLGLGVELEAGAKEGAAHARRLRCSIAVFACWALAVAAGFAFYLCRLVLDEPITRLDLGLKKEWYLRRGDWQAMPAYGMTPLERPVSYALVAHSATAWCEGRYRCIPEVLSIQQNHQRRGWDDIGPNFLVSGDGLVFEGRGANLVGAVVPSWNMRSVSIMFLGDYRAGRDAPTPVQLQHVSTLLAELVRVGALRENYTLLGHCQVVPWVYTPGQRLLDELHTFSHWVNVNTSSCLKG